MIGNPVTARLVPGDSAHRFGAVGFGDFKFGFSIDDCLGTQAHQLGRVGEPQLRLGAGGIASKHATRVDDKLFLPVEIVLRGLLRCHGRFMCDARVFGGAIKAQPADMRHPR